MSEEYPTLRHLLKAKGLRTYHISPAIRRACHRIVSHTTIDGWIAGQRKWPTEAIRGLHADLKARHIKVSLNHLMDLCAMSLEEIQTARNV